MAVELTERPDTSRGASRIPAGLSSYALALAGLTALAAALRFSTLGVQSFWHDEAVTVGRILRPSLIDTLRTIPSSEATPPLYYVLAWGWTKVFGLGEVGVRSLSALLGTALVPVTYLTAARLAPRRAALAAAALVACSPLLVWYSQEARAYELLALLCALSLLFVLQRRLVWWALVSALALATHYFALFPIAAEAAWLMWRERRRATWLAVGFVTAVGGALVPLVLHQKGRGHDEWIARIPLATRLRDAGKSFLVGPSGAPSAALYVLVAACLVASAVLLWRRTDGGERRRVLLPLAVGAAVVVVPLAGSLVGVDYLYYRNLIPAFVPLAIVAGAAFAGSRAGRRGALTAAVLCASWAACVIAVDVDSSLQRADWRDAAKAIGPTAATRALVVPFIGDDPVEVYLGHTTRMTGRASVAEVDVLGWTARGATHSRLPAPGFREVSRRRVGAFTLLRFRAPRPMVLSRVQLAHAKLGREHGAVLLQRPGGGA
jgi:uncharacterized membrane protein